MSEMILEKRKKEKDPIYKQPKFIIIGLAVIVILIMIISVAIIKSNSSTPTPEGTNPILSTIQQYLKELNKYAISEKRINDLLKNKVGKGDRYDDMVTLETSWLKVGWEQLSTLGKKEELFQLIDENIIKLIGSLPKFEKGTLVNKLYNIMILKENIENYKEDENIQYIINQLKNDKLKEEIQIIFLYNFINLPMQMGLFSKADYKTTFLSEITKQMRISPVKEIFNNLNQNMSVPPKNPIYMVLGAGQGEEKKRILSVEPFANICNTGIRTQSSQTEVDNYLLDNIVNYYTNSNLRSLMEKSRVNGKFSDEEYNKFIEECNLLKDNLTINNALEVFSRYNFSVETANTVIEYMKLNISPEKINIIRLGENNEANKNFVYDKNQVYILFDVVDLEETVYNANGVSIKIFRATTVANAKTFIYLLNECPNFMPKDSEFVLVSSKAYAERQLEAFNIIFGMFNYDLKLNYVIWNKSENPEYNEEKMVNTMMDIGVKGFNIVATSVQEIFGKVQEMKTENEFIKNIIQITNDAKGGKY